MKKFLLLICGLFICYAAGAQTIVSGKVVDEANKPSLVRLWVQALMWMVHSHSQLAVP